MVRSHGVIAEAKKRVLLIPYSGLGDLIMHLPLVTVLKEDFEVEVVIERTYESFGSFLKAQGILPHYLSCNQAKGLAGFIAKIVFFLTRIDHRSYRYILVYDRPLFTLLSTLLPSRKVIRYGLMTKTLRGPMGWNAQGKRANQTEAVMDFARYLSYPAVNESYAFPDETLAQCRRRASSVLDRFGINPNGDQFLAIGPFANHPYKQAPLVLFQHVVRYAMDRGFPVAMIGASADTERAEAFHRELGTPYQARLLNLVGRLEWEETLGLLSSSAVFVSNDSGIMHVSLASRTRTVAFFGPTDPYALVPKSNQYLHPVFLRLPCQPCWHKGPADRFRCPDMKKACLVQINADVVVRLVSDIITGLESTHPALSSATERS
jgi:ADP-heptose:LPS heptosyltransferase